MSETFNASIGKKFLTIRIPIASFGEPWCIPEDLLDEECEPTICINNIRGFAEDVLRQLLREAENGETPIHRIIDEAFVAAVEDGSQHVDFKEEANS